MSRKPFTPRAYQHQATAHLLDLPRCALWAGMGMGKTVSTLTALDTLFLAGEPAPALVIAPLRVAKSTWPAEAKKWAHLIDIEVHSSLNHQLAAVRWVVMPKNLQSTKWAKNLW